MITQMSSGVASRQRREPNSKAVLPVVQESTLNHSNGANSATASEYETQIAKLQEQLAEAEERAMVSEAKLAKAEKKNRELLACAERLEASFKNEKKWSQLRELCRQGVVFRLQQHIENTKMKSVIFSKDAQRSTKALFGDKPASWAIDASEIDVATLVSGLEVLEQGPAFREFFSFGCFNVSTGEALRPLRGPAFFEALVASTIVEKLFDNPFSACPPPTRDALTAVREEIAETDLPAVCKWTADTVAQLSMSDKIGVEDYRRGAVDTLNRYMRVVINKNDYLLPEGI
ncbi:uncharacterized protein DFL_003706 [Arthrobotrys flagrans]|uniref:Uncharacterized protein n=1 Tax=Arthrobotrys flagrans TaxID=97331 RepID=A0A437A2N3_ARTFL|nr:hypothetical protein DFL_003706 [Arthrobotrys flagrans]